MISFDLIIKGYNLLIDVDFIFKMIGSRHSHFRDCLALGHNHLIGD